MKKLCFALCIALMGCATMQTSSFDWIAIGPEFSPTKVQDIEVIGNVEDITRPYGNIGLLRIKNLKPDRETIKMGIEKGKKFVATKGANAILLGQYNSASEGEVDPRITLIMYAVKYMDTINEKDMQAMENFEELDILNARTEN